MRCVIGSGPAGVACARALLARGANVLMLDAGLELEPERAQVVRELASARPSEWRPGQVAKLKEGMAAGAKGIPLKLSFGSDYPYRETEQHIPWQGQGGMFGRFVGQVRQSSVLPIFGDGSQIQFLVHNEDLAAFIKRCAAGQTAAGPDVPATAFGNRTRAGQKNTIHSAAMAAGVGRVEIRRDVRIAIELPQRQSGRPDASKSATGFFTERGGWTDLPAVSD